MKNRIWAGYVTQYRVLRFNLQYLEKERVRNRFRDTKHRFSYSATLSVKIAPVGLRRV